jgi:hypothetical protein
MPAFAVLEPPGHADAAGHADRFVFLPERFSLSAFLFGPLWMIWRGLWLELLAYLAGVALIAAGFYTLGVGGLAMFLVFGLIQLLLGLEATTLVRWMRVRYGWRDSGVVIADDLDLAARRFFDDRFARRARAVAFGPAPAGSSAFPPPPPRPSDPVVGRSRPDVIGLFPEPSGGR